MRSIKLLGLAAIAAMVAMAFVGVSSAMAGNTQLCKVHPNNGACPAGQAVTHVHAVTLPGKKSVFLSFINIECDVLFLSTSGGVLALGNPQLLHGKFTYTNCSGGCVVTEESASALVKILRTAHELARVTYEHKVFRDCGFLLKCGYNGVGMEAHGLGPLLAAHPTGEFRLEEQTATIYLNHGFCPATGKLDLLLVPTSAIYIGT